MRVSAALRDVDIDSTISVNRMFSMKRHYKSIEEMFIIHRLDKGIP